MRLFKFVLTKKYKDDENHLVKKGCRSHYIHTHTQKLAPYSDLQPRAKQAWLINVLKPEQVLLKTEILVRGSKATWDCRLHLPSSCSATGSGFLEGESCEI